jgi:putative transposase
VRSSHNECYKGQGSLEFRVSRPNALWVVDFTYVYFVYVAFVIDAYTRGR